MNIKKRTLMEWLKIVLGLIVFALGVQMTIPDAKQPKRLSE